MVTKLEFFLIDADYAVTDGGRTVVRLFGRDEKGRTVIALYEKFLPYFYMLPKQSPKKLIEQLDGINLNGKGFEKLEVVEKIYKGRKMDVVKATLRAPPEVPIFRELVRKCGELEEKLETDVPFVKKFLIENTLAPLKKVLVEGETVKPEGLMADFVVKAESLEGLETELPELKVLSFDIEVYCPKGSPRPRHDPITMISLAGPGLKKVITWQEAGKKCRAPDHVEVLKDEDEVIRRFIEIVGEYDPDAIVGYNSDAFDFPYLRERARLHRIKLVLGRDGREVEFVRRGPSSAATTFGRLILDIYPFVDNIVSRSMRAESLDLGTVSQELLGTGKSGLGYEELIKKWQEGQLGELYEYSLKDSVLVEMLSERLLPMAFEFAKLTRNPIFDAARMTSGQIVEWFLLSRAFGMNIMAPNHPMQEDIASRRRATYVGGYVRQPEVGLHDNIAVLDYRSLYPSIIISHNIDPSTINCECCPSEESVHFCSKKKGFLPTVLREVLTKRLEQKALLKKARKDTLEYRILDARQQALKQVANSFYGYMGFSGARWYCLKCAEATTALGRMYIQQTIDAAEKEGFRVLYADSLPYGRKVLIKTPEKIVRIVPIGELYDKPIGGCRTLAFTKENKAAFVPIARVIRHPFSRKGRLLKIVTKYGTTIVTDKHSVYSYDNGIRLAEAGALKKGDCLISLTNIPVEVVYKEGAVFDMADMHLGKYKDQLLLYSDDLEFPAKKGICPYCKKKTQLSTHVHLRHGERRHKLGKESTFRYVGGANANTGKIPRYWTLDEDLAWLLGFYCAEGSLSDSKTGTGRKATISFGGQDISLIKKVKKFIDKKIGFRAKIIEDFDKRINKVMYYYRIQRLPIVALFQYGFGAGRGSEFKTVPPFIFASEEKLRKAFLKGYLDGDGTRRADKRYKTHFIRFSTKSKELAIGLQFLLKSLSHHGSNFKGGEIKHVAWQYRKDKPKINTLRLQSAKKSHENFCLADIKSIETAPVEKYVYDLEVEGCHNFVDAEGMLLVHNTDSCFISTPGKGGIEKKAGDFLEGINRTLPETMELELQGVYRRGVFVTKKRYAMLARDGTMVVKGLERVRRDWAPIAKDTQEAVLRALLEKADPKEAARIVRDAVKRLRERHVSKEDVTILTQLTKDPDNYELTAPHVEAAKKMIKKGKEARAGVIIRFIVKKGKGSISERSHPAEDVTLEDYDPEYYINNQVLPAALRIMEALGFKEAEELKNEQKKLGEFS